MGSDVCNIPRAAQARHRPCYEMLRAQRHCSQVPRARPQGELASKPSRTWTWQPLHHRHPAPRNHSRWQSPGARSAAAARGASMQRKAGRPRRPRPTARLPPPRGSPGQIHAETGSVSGQMVSVEVTCHFGMSYPKTSALAAAWLELDLHYRVNAKRDRNGAIRLQDFWMQVNIERSRSSSQKDAYSHSQAGMFGPAGWTPSGLLSLVASLVDRGRRWVHLFHLRPPVLLSS